MGKKITKSDISKRFRALENIPNMKVYNFQDGRKSRPQFKGFPDVVVIGHGVVAFIEIKMINTRDRFSKEQEEFGYAIAPCLQENKWVFYEVANEKNVDSIINKLINSGRS